MYDWILAYWWPPTGLAVVAGVVVGVLAVLATYFPRPKPPPMSGTGDGSDEEVQ